MRQALTGAFSDAAVLLQLPADHAFSSGRHEVIQRRRAIPTIPAVFYFSAMHHHFMKSYLSGGYIIMKKLNGVIVYFALPALILAAISIQPAQADSVIVVNTDDDNAATGDTFCTLREAINNANADSDTTGTDCSAGSGADEITFEDDYTIVLTSNLPGITSTLLINGAGQTVDVDGNNGYQIFSVASGGDLTLNALSVHNGFDANGGGVFNEGRVAITNSAVFGHNGTGGAGGVFNLSGTLTIANSTLYNKS
jgi:CSLREA domain-containing protein